MNREKFTVKFAETKDEILQTLKLRYQEMLLQYRSDNVKEDGIDFVPCDEYARLAICIDNDTGEVVGTYRVITTDFLPKGETFVTETEFNIDVLKNSGQKIAELSRAVVKTEYRNSIVLTLLLRFVVNYIIENQVRYVVGTASFHGVDKKEWVKELSYLAAYHSDGYDGLYSLDKQQIQLLDKDSLDPAEIKRTMPALLRIYTAFGAMVSNDSFTDYEFGSVDVLIVLDTKNCNFPYMKRLLKL
ncbi:MAG: GNAT family N-acetyltransferase [Clostridia bacterium]|nr:GNAT family N-acetyltransferase [Clostridia bacterium]